MRRTTESLLDRTCEVLDLPEPDRQHLRRVCSAIGLSPDDPAQIHVAVVGAISHVVVLHRDVLRKQPKDIHQAANVVAEKVSLATAQKMSVETGKAAQQLSKLVDAKLDRLERRRSRRMWVGVITVTMLLCIMVFSLGWSQGQLRSVTADLFWNDLGPERQLVWSEYIAQNPRAPESLSSCRTVPELQRARDGGIGCQYWQWIATPAVRAETPALRQLLTSPSVILGGLTYPFFTLIGGLAGAGLTFVWVIWRGRK